MRFGALLIVIMLAMAALSFSGGAARTEGGRYVPGYGITIWCAAEQHPITPVGHPWDYSNELGWLFSGEPECALGDVHNMLREEQGEDREEFGIGGFAWQYYGPDVGTTATAHTDDVYWGDHTYMTLYASAGDAEDESSEGCGPQSIVLPEPYYHWQEFPPPPALFWAFLDPIGVDDELNVCGSTTGTIEATFGA